MKTFSSVSKKSVHSKATSNKLNYMKEKSENKSKNDLGN